MRLWKKNAFLFFVLIFSSLIPSRSGAQIPTVAGDGRGPSLPSHLQVNVMDARYAARGDGINDDTIALQAAIDDAGRDGTVVFPSRTVFRVSGLKMKEYSKIVAWGAKLVPLGPGQTVLTIPSGPTLQTNGKVLIEGLEIDGKGQPRTTGLKIENHAQVELIAPFIHDCSDTGLLLDGTQFADLYAPRIYKNYVGIKIYSKEGAGGGNSNNFFGGQIVGNTIGVLQSTPKLVQTSNYFYNTAMLSNTEAAVAVFGSLAGSTLYLIGGAPEGNAPPTAPVSVTVDGHQIPRATLYASDFSTIYVEDLFIADASAAPWSIVRNHSKIAFHNTEGYGKPSASLVVADATSSVLFSGNSSTVGHVNNIAVWPSSITTQAGLWAGSGQPLFVPAGVSNLFGNEARTPNLSGEGIIKSRSVDDSIFGQVNSAKFDSKPGTSENNRVIFGGLSHIPRESSDVLVSFLMKPVENCNAGCDFQVGLYPGGDAYGTSVNLTSGHWTRVVVLYPSWPGGKDVKIVVYPKGSSGAAVEFAGVQASLGAHGSIQTLQDFSQVIGTGAVGQIPRDTKKSQPDTGRAKVFRCELTGKLPAGSLTTDASACGASEDTGLRIP